KECERQLAVLLYQLLTEYCGFTSKWGILTGVRPVKLMHRLTGELGEQGAFDYFTRRLLVSPEKTALCRQTAELQEPIVRASRPESFSLYVSIPFCPTRCAYCSFVSQSIEKASKLLPDYVEYLKKELRQTGEIARALGLRLETVYFGGGTPTTLSAEQLSGLIRVISEAFDLSTVREYTVEAGRPDTITPEKLAALKSGGVTRISINPQTMNDAVLERIGRRHTAQRTLDAFAMARKAGMNNINMDTIAGLPGDSAESFAETFRILTELSPESITVHTLALKRSSYLNHEEGLSLAQEAAAVDQMVSHSQQVLSAAGYLPYYLYRQSKMLGNLENVGWTKPGFEGLYNVYIMEETHTILACGAGATTKLRSPQGEQIERIFNFKFPYEYMERFDQMQSRKEGILKFYEHCK
ncbi:MAG: coproporphyrinogen dehydrogenase HemZ, partial [Firmicutes bacterium]|nr:coproporphyrinogen dehydrogenase HemZ [Bacillota bacterium]